MPRRCLASLSWVLLLASAPGHAEELQLPNLKALPAFEFSIGEPDEPEQGRRALRFSFATENVGGHALELLGWPPMDLERSGADQCVMWGARACTQRRSVGEFIFHPQHHHWHFDAYARYELRRLTNGSPDMSASGLVAGGQKVSFCLMDSGRSADDGRSFEENPFFYRACAGILQGISSGWMDVYGAGLPGQQIVVDGVSDGDYALVLTIDPDGRLFETARGDNISVKPIRLVEHGTEVIAA